MSNVTGNLAHSPTNSDAWAEARKKLEGECKVFGAEIAAGVDALPKFAFKVADASRNGIISTEKDTDGKDDIHRLYEHLIKGASKKAVHEHTPNGVKAQVSKARQIVNAAAKPTGDFYQTMEKVADKVKAVRAADPKAKVRSVYPALVEAAREQLKQDDDLTDEQIESLVMKPEADAPELIDWLEAVEKRLGEIITGENKHGIKDDSQDLVQAHNFVKQRLAAMQLAKDLEETLAKAAALGIKVVPAEQAAVEMEALTTTLEAAE